MDWLVICTKQMSILLTIIVLLFRRLSEFEELNVDVHFHPDDETHLQEHQLQLTNT